MRYAIVITSTGTQNGSFIFIDQLVEYIKGYGDSCIVAKPDSVEKLKIIETPMLRSKYSRLFSGLFLAIYFKILKVDIVVLNDASALWLAPIFRMASLRTIGLLHIRLRKQSRADLGGHNPIVLSIIKWTGGCAHRILSVTPENKFLFKRKFHFVGNFVSPRYIAEGHKSKKKLYDVIYVGRIDRNKNFDLFARIVEDMEAVSTTRLRVAIAGDSLFEASLLARQRLKRTKLVELGWLDGSELLELYDSSRVLILPSLSEGFPTVLLEAHARGLPCIINKACGFAATVVSGYGGATGFVFDDNTMSRRRIAEAAVSVVAESHTYFHSCVQKAELFTAPIILENIKDLLENAGL